MTSIIRQSSPSNRQSSSSSSPTRGSDSSKTSEVSNGFFSNLNSNLKQLGINAAVGAARPLLARSEDKHAQFLLKLTGQDVAALVNKIAPQLPEFLRHQLSTELADYVEHNPKAINQIIRALITRIIVNLATSLYPGEAEAFSKNQPLSKTISLEEFSQTLVGRLTEIALEEFDTIDQKVKQEPSTPLKDDLFLPLANRLLDLMFYKDASLIGRILRSAAKRWSVDLSKKMLDIYQPLNLWLSSKTPSSASLQDNQGPSVSTSATQPFNVDQLIQAAEPILLFMGESVAKKYQNEDIEILQRLTGTNDVTELVKFAAPKIVDQVLSHEAVQTVLEGLPFNILPLLEKNKKTVEGVGNAILLRLISNLAQEFFAEELEEGKEVSVDNFIAEMSVKISNIFEDYIRDTPEDECDFQPVARKLLKAILPKNSFILAFFNRHQERLTQHAALALKKSYDSIALRDDAKLYRQRLNDLVNDDELTEQIFNFCYNVTNLGRNFIAEIFSDKAVIVEQMLTSFEDQDLPEEPIKGVASGISKIVRYHKRVINQFLKKKALTLFLSKDDKKRIVDSISKIPANVQASYDDILNHLKKDLSGIIDDEDFLDQLANELAQDFPQNPLGWMAANIQNALQLTLFKGIVHLLEKVPNDKRQPIKKLFPEALQILLDVGADKLPEIVNELKELDADTEQEEIKQLLEPLVNKLIAIFYEDEAADGLKLRDHLPIPVEIKPFVESIIRENAYKALLPIITAFTPWIEAKQENKDRLYQSFDNRHAAEACHILGAMTSQAIPYSFQEFHQEFAESITKQFSYLFSAPGATNSPSLTTLQGMIQHLIKSLAKNRTPAMKDLLSFVQEFAEAGFLRCFADFAELLKNLEEESEDHPDGKLLVRGAISLLDEVKEHLKTIAKVKADLKEYRAEKIDQEKFLEKFEKAGRLHPALRGGGDLEAKIEFFEKLSKSIFSIVGVNKETNLPIPQFLKHPVWDAFEEMLVPTLLADLFEKIQDPHTLNLILISLFEQINAEEGDLNVTIKDEDIRHYKDGTQDKLEQISGELIQALVQMQRSAITNWALKKDKIRTLAGQAMGQPLRKMLEEKPILKIVDDLVMSLIPSLHPGIWLSEDRVLIDPSTGKKTSYPKGTFLLEGAAEPNFDHLFPRTEKQKKTYEKASLEAQKKAQKDVVRGIAHTIENQTQYIFLGAFRKLWQRIRGWVNKVLTKIGSVRLKKIVNSFLDGVSDYLIRPILMITTYPILIAVRRLLRFYFVHQSALRAEDVNNTIHQNAIYRSIEEIIKLILKEKEDVKENSDKSNSTNRSSHDLFDEDELKTEEA